MTHWPLRFKRMPYDSRHYILWRFIAIPKKDNEMTRFFLVAAVT